MCQSSKSSQLNEFRIKARRNRSFGPVHASQAGTVATPSSVVHRWLLVPVGDGDFRHIGYKVKMPDAFEIASNEVIVGRLRLPEKADMVIPVATGDIHLAMFRASKIASVEASTEESEESRSSSPGPDGNETAA